MNAPKLPWIGIFALAFSWSLGPARLVHAQTPAAPPPEVQAELDALRASRLEGAAQAARRRAQAMQAASPPAGSIMPAAPSANASAMSTPGASADLPALRVAVLSVNESRNNQGRGTINLNLSIAGEGLPPNAAVKQSDGDEGGG